MILKPEIKQYKLCTARTGRRWLRHSAEIRKTLHGNFTSFSV